MPEIQCPHCGQSETSESRGDGEPEECSNCGRSIARSSPKPRPRLLKADAPLSTDRSPSKVPSRAPTDVSIVTSGIAGLVLTLLFYALVVYPLRESYFGELFGARGWVPYIIALFSFWALVIVFLKYRMHQTQLASLDIDLLPEFLGKTLAPANAHVFSSYLDHIATQGPRNILVERLRWGVRFFRAREDVRELATQLSERARTDAEAIESSYTMLRTFIWAIPILGFIGTVLGIGEAVSGFSHSVAAAADLELMKESIGSVTTGLGVAFDTTLLALVMSILIMFPISALQKAEEDFLTRSEVYCDEHLLCRVSEQSPTGPDAPLDRPDPANDSRASIELEQLVRTVGDIDRRISRLEPPTDES